MTLMTLLISLKNDNGVSVDYYKCIKAHPCAHEDEELSFLHTKDKEALKECRIKRHLNCIKTDIEKEKK